MQMNINVNLIFLSIEIHKEDKERLLYPRTLFHVFSLNHNYCYQECIKKQEALSKHKPPIKAALWSIYFEGNSVVFFIDLFLFCLLFLNGL